MKKNKGTVGKVLKLIGPYKYLLLLSLVFAMISVALTLYAPILIGDGVDVLIGKGQVKFPEVFAILKKLAVVIVLTCVAQWLMNLCNNRITYRVVKDVRIKAFARLQVLPLQPPAGGDDQPDHHRCGTVFRRIVNGIFPVFHRDCYDFRNACLYAWYSCTDCVGRDLDHTGIFVCSKLYCKKNVYDVSEAVRDKS